MHKMEDIKSKLQKADKSCNLNYAKEIDIELIRNINAVLRTGDNLNALSYTYLSILYVALQSIFSD